MDARPFDILPPKTLLQERYRIVHLIGRGGMGAVYEATDIRLKISVALKQTLVGGAQFRKAFQREALLLARLRHAALPVVTDYFIEDDAQFLVMQFIPGPDLATQLAKRDGPFPISDVLAWADQLLRTLEYLHGQEPPVTHRDIKPQNLKLATGGEIVLLDFGLAKGAATQSQVAGNSSVFGFTPLYAPLEQIRSSGTGPRSDLYALAATLYHLLVGTPPIDALERAEASVNGLPDPLIPPHEANPLVHPAVSDVLVRALALRTDARPVHAAEMRALLRDAAHATYDWEQATVLVTHDSMNESALLANAEHGPLATNTTKPDALAPELAIRQAHTRRRWALGGLTLLGLILLALLGLRGISIASGTDQSTATSMPQRVELIATKAATPTVSPTATSTQTASPTHTASPTLTTSPTLTPTATTRPTARPRPKPTSTPLPPTIALAPPTELPTELPTALPTETLEPTRRSRPKPTAALTAPSAKEPTSAAYPPP